jgi:hypothetical protein
LDSKPGPALPFSISALPGAAFLPPEEAGALFAELAAARQAIAHKDAALNAANLKSRP